jgi:hypothetical protein
MTGRRVTVSNIVPGLAGSTILQGDVRIELEPDLILVIRDVTLIQAPHGGRFVGFPRRYHGSCAYKVCEFEGAAAPAVVEEIRRALRGQLATAEEIEMEVRDADTPF